MPRRSTSHEATASNTSRNDAEASPATRPLFIPPLGSRNREIRGELGNHVLDLGNGYLVHGTPHTYTIGTAATHGCIRLHDDDIEWLYLFVPVGTPVYIY